MEKIGRVILKGIYQNSWIKIEYKNKSEEITHYMIGIKDINPYTKKIKQGKESLEKLLFRDGTVMINIENGKEYLTYELFSLADVIGKRYVICQLIKDGEQYGQISTKPMELFKLKNY